MKKAIIYSRVSTAEQKINGYSQRDQEEKLIKYCKSKSIEIVKSIKEDYSAKNFKRPEYQKMFSEVKSKIVRVDLLLVVKWDRFSRNTEDSFIEISKLRNLGIKVVAIEQEYDEDRPEAIIMKALDLATPQVDNLRRSLNSINGMRKAKKEGRWVATAPVGYKYDRNNFVKSTLIPSEKALFVKALYEDYATGAFTREEVRLKYNRLGLSVKKSNIDR